MSFIKQIHLPALLIACCLEFCQMTWIFYFHSIFCSHPFSHSSTYQTHVFDMPDMWSLLYRKFWSSELRQTHKQVTRTTERNLQLEVLKGTKEQGQGVKVTLTWDSLCWSQTDSPPLEKIYHPPRKLILQPVLFFFPYSSPELFCLAALCLGFLNVPILSPWGCDGSKGMKHLARLRKKTHIQPQNALVSFYKKFSVIFPFSCGFYLWKSDLCNTRICI